MNDQNAVSRMDNPVAEDIQNNSYFSQSSTNVKVLVVNHLQKLETSSQPLLSELVDEMQAVEAEIAETKNGIS